VKDLLLAFFFVFTQFVSSIVAVRKEYPIGPYSVDPAELSSLRGPQFFFREHMFRCLQLLVPRFSYYCPSSRYQPFLFDFAVLNDHFCVFSSFRSFIINFFFGVVAFVIISMLTPLLNPPQVQFLNKNSLFSGVLFCATHAIWTF